MLVVVALCAIVICGFVSFAIDGGLQLYQLRLTQNAVDSASLDAARVLETSCASPPPSTLNSDVWKVVDDLTTANASNIASFTGYYLDSQGAQLMVSGSTVPIANNGAVVPTGACGVHLQATSSWAPTLSRLLGVHALSVVGSAGAIATARGSSGTGSLGVMALGSTGKHTVIGEGAGAFTVNGSLFSNDADGIDGQYVCFRTGVDPDHNGDDDTAPNNDPDQDGTFDREVWGSTACGSGEVKVNYVDTVDSKESSRFVVTGAITSVANNPFDASLGYLYPMPTSPDNVAGQTGLVPYDPSLPAYVMHQQAGGLIAYGSLTMLNPGQVIGGPVLTNGQLTADPLAAAYGTAPDQSIPGCGGASLPVFTAQVGTAGPFAPGVYTFPLDVTGSPAAGPTAPTFLDCPGGQPGIYVFEEGVKIHPPASSVVYGKDVLMVTQEPIPNSLLPNNVGDGAPIGAIDDSGTSVGTGLNLSAAIGGAGAVNLTAPTSGAYSGVLLWQAQRGTMTGGWVRANFGLNTSAGDQATVNLNGVVGDTTMNEPPNAPGVTDRQNYYQISGNHFPYDQGGLLLSGQPNLSGNPPGTPQGVNTITGSAVVDIFFTEGNTATTVNAVASKVQQSGSTAAVRLVE